MIPIHKPIVDSISLLIKSHSFTHFGFTELKTPPTLKAYENWLDQGFHGDMEYLNTHYPLKADPQAAFKGMRSAILIAKPYDPTISSSLRIAAYAKEKDYHLVFKKELESIAKDLRNQFNSEEFLCFTDSSPFLERDFAHQAGLGWIGKNTCLIDRKHGSLFFIGEILTSLPLSSEALPSADFCGTCNRCIDACPTNAIKPDKVLDANLCISYLTIESKSDPKPGLRPLIGDWFFGCDICQTVCPWNEKHSGRDLMKQLSQPRQEVTPELTQSLKEILSLSNKQLMDLFKESPLSRARGYGLKRNALIVIGNLKIKDLASEVTEVSRRWPRLLDLCKWTLSQLQ